MNFHSAKLALEHLAKQEQKLQSQIDRLELQRDMINHERVKITSKLFLDGTIKTL